MIRLIFIYLIKKGIISAPSPPPPLYYRATGAAASSAPPLSSGVPANGLVQATINKCILFKFKIIFFFKLNLLARFIEHIIYDLQLKPYAYSIGVVSITL